MADRHVHGEKGAFVGGCWIPIEECDKVFCNMENACHTTRIKKRVLRKKDGCSSKKLPHHECLSTCKGVCLESRTDFSSVKEDGSYDIVIIGAGCIGAGIARELSKTTASVLLIDAADDVTQGATKGNSGIVHAGYDDKPGSVRAKYCWSGNQMFPQLDRELHFGYEMNGSLVVAMNEEEKEILNELYERGQKNGVKNLSIIDGDEVRKLEPHINPKCVGALRAPDAGTIIPYEYTIALAENAADNGVEVRVRRKVIGIEKMKDNTFIITVEHWEPSSKELVKKHEDHIDLIGWIGIVIPVFASALCWFALGAEWNTLSISIIAIGFIIASLLFVAKSKFTGAQNVTKTEFEPSPGTKLSGISFIEKIKTNFIVNSAGCESDKIAEMIGDKSFKIKPRLGEYILLHKREGGKVSHTLFPAPHPVLGKGVLVQGTLWGNLILGPTARDVLKFNPDKQAYEIDESVANASPESIMTYILSKCRNLVPEFNAADVIHTFSGARAKSTRGDWVIEPSSVEPSFIHAAAIDSPGIAGSPAIAVEVVNLLKQAGANVNEKNKSFNPNRAPIIIPKNGWKGIKCGPVGKYTDMDVNVVCKCEKVTEREIVTACQRSLPIDSTQAIRKRTRAGMGHCQGDPNNYDCEARVAAIIAREKNMKVKQVGRRPWPASSMLPKRWIDDKDKADIESLSHSN